MNICECLPHLFLNSMDLCSWLVELFLLFIEEKREKTESSFSRQTQPKDRSGEISIASIFLSWLPGDLTVTTRLREAAKNSLAQKRA